MNAEKKNKWSVFINAALTALTALSAILAAFGFHIG